MGKIEDLKAKQEKLKETQAKLDDSQRELVRKKNELDEAKRENENKKSELIDQLISEVQALQDHTKKYEYEIKLINSQLKDLEKRFAITQPTATEQPTPKPTTVEPSAPKPTTIEPSAPKPTTIEPSTPKPTTIEPSAPKPTTVEPSAPKPTTIEPSAPKPTTVEPSAPKPTTIEQHSGNLNESVPNINTYDGFMLAINKLLEEIKDTKKGISKRGLSKAGKKTMEEAKSKLKQYESQLKGKRKALLKQKGAEIYDNDITNIKNTREQINKIREDIGMGQRGEYSNTASYLYNSPENIRESNKHQSNNLLFNQSFQEDLKTGAIYNIFNKNTEAANNFFRRIAEGKYTQADYQFYRTNSAILSPCLQKYGIAIPNNPRGGMSSGGGVETLSGQAHTSTDYQNLERGEAFEKGGIAGIIDKALSNCNNLTPGQRNTWKSIGVLGCYAAGIYGLYKFFTSDKMGFWGKALTTGGVIFASQALTGENPIALFQKLITGGFSKEELESKFGNAFGDAVDGVHNSGIEGADNISGAMYSLMVFNENTKVGDVRGLSERFKKNPQERELFRGQATKKLGKRNFERFSAVFSENFDENKRNNWLTSIGINNEIDDNKLVYELAGTKTMNTIVINKFLSDHGVKVTDNETMKKEFEQYKKSMNDNNQAINISVLEKHKNDRFMVNKEATYTDREEDITNKESLSKQVDQLPLDEQKKTELKTAIESFYDKRTIESKPNPNDFNLKIENGSLILTSHSGQKTEIDLNKKQLVGFGKGITFYDLGDLLNAADLTNKILLTQKGKSLVGYPPFEHKFGKAGEGIYFNDAETISPNFDTAVLLINGLTSTPKVIDIIKSNPKDYASYLSERWIKSNKIDINSSLYPTVKELSDEGITFFNEQEVKDLENRLKSIKERLGFSESTTESNPFKIGNHRLKFDFTEKLSFTAVNNDEIIFEEDINGRFPTITNNDENKTKFLNYLNNKNNNMRGSKTK